MRRGDSGTARPGDIVKARKGPVMHVGVLLDDGSVFHNTPERGEHVSSIAEFSRGNALHVERRSDSERLRTLASAGSGAHGRRYHLLNNNCEHTLHRARDGRPRSPQLRAWTIGVLGAVAGTLLVRHWGGTVAGWELGRRLARRI